MTTESFLTAFSNALLIKDYGRAETMLAPWLRSQLPPGGLKHVMRETLGDAPDAAEFSISPLTYDDPASMRESVTDNADENGERSLTTCDGTVAEMGPPSYPVPNELTNDVFEGAYRLEFIPDEDLEEEEDFSFALYVAVVNLGERQAIGYLEPSD
jgi:hypothetical protein